MCNNKQQCWDCDGVLNRDPKFCSCDIGVCEFFNIKTGKNDKVYFTLIAGFSIIPETVI